MLNFKPIFSSGINATIVRGICSVIDTTLTKYKDPATQSLVRELLVAYEHMNNVLKANNVTKELFAAPSLKGAQATILALGWANLVALKADHESDVGKKQFPVLVESQAGLYQLSLISGLQFHFLNK